MDPISLSEMEIRDMKRKELQVLCKKHSIPANLSNLEMANRLISLLMVEDKPMTKGKSCMRSTLEQASENLSDGVKRLSKKVRFSPENETFEFMASETKRDEIGRRERARRRSMLRQVDGIACIETEKNTDNVKCVEDIVNKPIKVTRSKGKTISGEVENVVKAKCVKRGQKSVASESVSMVKTRVSARSLKIKEVEKKREPEEDALLRKNQTKRTLRKRGVKMDNEVSEIEVSSIKKTEAVNDNVALKKNEPHVTRSSRTGKFGHEVMANKRLREDEGLVETEKVEVVKRGRTKKQRALLVEDENIKLAAPETECKLEMVLQIKEPLRQSSRQSVVPQTEKMSIDGSKNETEKMKNTLNCKDEKAKRSSSRRKSVAVSDAILSENDIYKKPRNRRGDLMFEEENNVIKGSVVEEPPMRSRRNGNRRQSIMPQTEKAGTDGPKGKKDKTISNRSTVEENTKSTRKSSRRKSIVASDLTLFENVRKHKSTSRKMDSILEEGNAAIEGSPVEERPRKSMRNDAKAQKVLVTDGAGEVVESTEDRFEELHAHSVPLEEGIAVAENGSGPVLNSTEVLSESFKEINFPKPSGLVETASDSVKLQKYHDETEGLIGVSGISCLGVVSSINNEDEADKNKVLQDFDSNILSSEFEVESKVAKEVDLAEASLGGCSSQFDQPDISAKQVEHVDLERETENIRNYESETRASGSLKFQNDDEETLGVIANEDDFDSDNLALLETEVESNEDYSRIDQPCIDEKLELTELQMAEKNDMGNNTDLSSPMSDDATDVENSYITEEKLFVYPEVVLDSSHVEKSTPCEVKGRETLDSGKLTYLSGGVSHDGVDVENSCGIEEKHFIELEGVLDNSSGRKYTPIKVEGINRHRVERSASVSEVHKSSIGKQQPSVEPDVDEELGHNVEGCLAESKGINSIKNFFENANEGLKESCDHITDEMEVTPSQTKEMIRDEIENPTIIEPTDVEELANEFDAEGHSAQVKGSVLKENFGIVNEENEDSNLLDTSEQKESTALQVEAKQKDEVEFSASGSDVLECVGSTTPAFMVERETEVETLVRNSSVALKVPAVADPIYLAQNIAESVQSPSVTSRDMGSCLKEQNHSIREATPVSASNEIKSLMMVNLDWTPSLEFRKAHVESMLQEDEDHVLSAVATVEPVEDHNRVIIENLSGEMRQSPLPRESVDMPSSSFTLCKDFEMKKPELSVFADKLIEFQETCNSSEQSRNQSFGYDCSTELDESEGTENEFDAENETQPLEATSPETTSVFAEDQDESEGTENEFGAGVNTTSAENETQPLEATSPETTSVFAEDQDESEGTENEFDAGVNTTSAENKTQPLEATSPETTSVFAEDQDESEGTENEFDAGVNTSAENETQPLEATSPQTASVFAEDQDESESTENEFDAGVNTTSAENETQPLEETSLETTSVFAEDQGNGSTGIEMSPTELRLLFDDKAQRDGGLPEFNNDDDVSNEGLLLGNKFTTEEEDSRKVVLEDLEEEERSPIEFNDEDTLVIGSFDHEGLADSPCLETNASSSALACSANVSKLNFPQEKSEGKKEIVLEQGHDDVAKEVNFLGASDNLADDNALDYATSYVGKADIADKESENVSMEDKDTRIHEDPTPVASDEVARELDDSLQSTSDRLTNARNYEDLVNASKKLDGVDSQYDDGMFDDLDGDEMEIIQELIHIEKDDSSCSSDQFLGHEKGSVEVNATTSTDNSFGEEEIEVKAIAANDMANYASIETLEFEECKKSSEILTTRADSVDESHIHTSNVSDMTQCVDETKEYAEYQHLSKVSECWFPDPEFGISQASLDSNMFSSWELNLFSEGEATRSVQVGSNIPFTEEEDTGVEAQVNEETKTCNEAMVELTEQCEAAKVSESVIEDKSFKYADGAFHGGQVIDINSVDKSEQLNSSSSMTLGDVVADFEEHFRSEAHISEGEQRTAAEVADVKGLDMFDDQCLTDFSLFPTEEEKTECKFAEVSEQAAREMTGCESFPRELSDKGFAAEDVAKNPGFVDVVNTYGIDEKGELSSFETTSNILKIGKQSSLIRGTPKKVAIAFDMKENATSVKRENVGSVTANSVAKRRALSELFSPRGV